MKIKITVFIMVMLCALILYTAVSAADAQNISNSSVQLANIQVPFVENQGQQPDNVKYTADTYYGTAYLTCDGITHAITVNNSTGIALKEKFLNKNGNTVSINPQGQEQSQTHISYFIGDSSQTDLPSYNQISLGELYPGITVNLKAHGGNIEKLFQVQPGSNVENIKIQISGAKNLKIMDDGRLAIKTGAGTIYMSAPHAYQDSEKVSVKYKLLGKDTYGFQVGEYDHSKALTIDPYITYLGGSSADGGNAIAVDGSGNVYITGSTSSSNFPTTTGAYDTNLNSSSDVFVSKFNSNASTLVYSTYLGGTNTGSNSIESGNAITVDSSGNAYIGGTTPSTDFPTVSGAYQTTLKGAQDGFITELNSDGTGLVYSTYLGGNNTYYSGQARIEGVRGIAIHDSKIYVTGQTTSSNFPTTSGANQTTLHGAQDAFVSIIDPSRNDDRDLLYSTYLGGSSTDTSGTLIETANGIAVDNDGSVYITGQTSSSDFPTTSGAYDTTLNGNVDAFVTKFSSDLSTLDYSTYLGGSATNSQEKGMDIAVDSNGDAYIAGQTQCTDFPTTTGAYQPTLAGYMDGFVTKLNSAGTAIINSTYIGGSSSSDYLNKIALDNNNVYLTGYTTSSNFPTTTGAYQTTLSGPSDAFISKLNSDLSTLNYSTFLGGSSYDYGNGIAVSNSKVYIAGQTGSSNFPTTTGAYQTSSGGSTDAFAGIFTI